MQCIDAGQCGGATPFCVGNNCVQCTQNTECVASQPVCEDNACRLCQKDAECDTTACGADGRCIAEDAIVWLSDAGVDAGTCTRAAPCRNLIYATTVLSNARNHIVMATGQYNGDGSLASSPAAAVVIHANGSTIVPKATSGFDPGGTSLTLKNAIVSGASTNFSIALRATSRLESVTIANASPLIVRAPVVARDLHVSGALGTRAILIDAAAGELTIDGGTIRGGMTGIEATVVGSKVHLKNLLVSETALRGLELAQSSGELEFSTVVDAGANTATVPCAASCNASLSVRSSIIIQETCGGVVRDAIGPCTFLSSIVSNVTPPTGATNVDPKFVNRAAHDYHLQATSPAKDAVDNGPTTDFEGDPRPRGMKYDIGADEAP